MQLACLKSGTGCANCRIWDSGALSGVNLHCAWFAYVYFSYLHSQTDSFIQETEWLLEALSLEHSHEYGFHSCYLKMKFLLFSLLMTYFFFNLRLQNLLGFSLFYSLCW